MKTTMIKPSNPSKPSGQGALALVVAALMTVPATGAWACGGCFSPPGRTQILQDAERILFFRDGTNKKTTVWIEIKYNGPAKDFGWVLPLPKKPGKVGVGTSYVLDRLDQAAAPRFVTKRGNTMENCRHTAESSDSVGCGVGFAASDEADIGTAGGAFANEAGAQGDNNKVKVLEHAQAGPYDYKIIATATAAAALDWLTTNGYDTPKSAKSILESHVKKGDVFIAVKLVSGAGVNEIRPITLEMDDADACVPLRLTSVAAVQDMNIVVYLLGPGRAIPKNHMHVVLNPLKLRWDGGVQNYPAVLSSAIDEAAGRAFITEFAGDAKSLKVPAPITTSQVDATGMFNQPIAGAPNTRVNRAEPLAISPWRQGDLFDSKLLDPSPLQHVKTVDDLVQTLRDGNLILVQDSAAAIESVAKLAAKAGKSASVLQYYLQIRAKQVTPTKSIMSEKLDGAELFKVVKEGVIDPVYSVGGMLAQSKILTRLSMRIDPQEMDRDPLFAFNKDLPAVKNLHTAEMHPVCPGGDFVVTASRLKLEGGQSYIVQGERRPTDFSNPAANTRTGLTTSTAVDPRWKEAKFAMRIEVLEETGPPKTVPAAMIEKLDGLIAGSTPGKPTVPAGTTIDQSEVRYTMPDSDGPAGLKFGAEKTQPDTGGCTLDRSSQRPFSMALMMSLALGVLLLRRRRIL